MRRLLNIAFIAVLTSLPAWGQSTSVTATITDTDGQTWNNGTGTATFVPGNPQNYHWPGGTIPNQVPFTMNNSGTFTVSLPDNTTITPLGSAWNFSICPNASSPCVTKQITTSGTSMNLSTQLSSVAIGPRFPATSLAYGYLDKEISPLPVQGAFYWNVTSLVSRQWTGSVWQNLAGGGGGGGTPSGPVNSIQGANAGLNGFVSDSTLLINNTTHTLTTQGGNMLISALSSLPRSVYDPMDTNRSGGLAAAIAGTSGFTPTQVIQATIDYAECQVLTGAATYPGINIPLPSSVTINISGLKLWSNMSMGGDPYTFGPNLQHTDSSQIMIQPHSASDTITCADGPHTPGGITAIFLHNFRISGMGAVGTNNDVGIWMKANYSAVERVTGLGNGFGGPAIFLQAVSVFGKDLGYPGAQLQGCMTYNQGVLPVSGSIVGNGKCSSVEDGTTDGGMENVYATDAQAFASGHAAGPCYPNCSAIGVDSVGGTYDFNLFAQVSSVGVRANAGLAKLSDIRVDYTSREAVQIFNSCSACSVEQVRISNPCVDSSLSTAYGAGTATGCGAITNTGTGVPVSDVYVSTATGVFPPSYTQCWILDSDSGGSSASNVYTSISYQGNPDNGTSNDWGFCGAFNSSQGSSRINFPAMSPKPATGSTVNVNGITSISLNGQTVTAMKGGIAGQHVTVWGPGTMQQSASGQANSIQNSNGLNNTLFSQFNALEYVSQNGVGNNYWLMVSGPPNQTPTHILWAGNPTPSNPSVLDFFGVAQARAIPAFTIDVSQLHGTTSPNSACFEQDALYTDGSHVTSALACTNINLAAMTTGQIFVNFIPGAQMNLYLVSNAQGNGVALGKYGAYTGTAPGSANWGNTLIAAGGDGSTPPSPGDNNTGEYWAPFGILLNTTTTQPGCTAEYRGLTWLIQNTGPLNDTFQICERQSTGSYAWVSPSGGGGTLTGSGTVGTMALWTGSTTNLGNGHYSESGGLATVTLPVQVNDGSGTNGLTLPEANAIGGASGNDAFWSDSGATNGVPGLMANENGSGAKSIVEIATPGTSGDSVKLAANGKDIVDNGPDGSNFTPTKVCGSGCGTGGTSTLSTGANDNNGWLTINTGTSPTAGAGIVTVTFGGTYSAARKCSVIGANALALGLGNNQMIVTSANSTSTNFIITAANSAALAASSTYIVFYRCGK